MRDDITFASDDATRLTTASLIETLDKVNGTLEAMSAGKDTFKPMVDDAEARRRQKDEDLAIILRGMRAEMDRRSQ